eukprot:CAMPEP_0115164882 /NCGR_PEP_ID=MMETSP0227-20121206/73276_1 /TAXON_ID=89957 /ORGANISM="Polarella glacialis, Strain CCMP 1383" /LENGTH=53 /DNA_ID=CAMNT_0002577277 /DNA_START=54 /DNA_END=212 /DNA_ORIENTATION=+
MSEDLVSAEMIADANRNWHLKQAVQAASSPTGGSSPKKSPPATPTGGSSPKED